MKTLFMLTFTTIFGTYALGLLGVIEMDKPTVTLTSAKSMWRDNIAQLSSINVADTPPAADHARLSFTERISRKAQAQKS